MRCCDVVVVSFLVIVVVVVIVDLRNLHLKFGCNWVSNS